MKLKLDENLGARGLSILQNMGYDASTVSLQGWQGEPDDSLIRKCADEERALVTLDMDFANTLRFKPSSVALVGAEHSVVFTIKPLAQM